MLVPGSGLLVTVPPADRKISLPGTGPRSPIGRAMLPVGLLFYFVEDAMYKIVCSVPEPYSGVTLPGGVWIKKGESKVNQIPEGAIGNQYIRVFEGKRELTEMPKEPEIKP